MRILVLATFLIGIGCIVNGQQAAPDPHYKLIRGSSFVQTKNYYLLTLLQQDSAVCNLLERDTTLAAIAINKLTGLSKASFSVMECPSTKPVSLQPQAGKV